MGFFRLSKVVTAVCVALSAMNVVAESMPSGENGKEPSKLVPGYQAVPKLNFAPIMGNDVVRMSQEGTPVTKLDDYTYSLAREIADSILKDEAERRARGEKVPERIKRDIWAEREKEIAERRAKYGLETTKKFTIPGTTPEISARIFSPQGRVSKDEHGNTVYETPMEIVTAYRDGTVKIVPRKVVNITLTKGEADVVPVAEANATTKEVTYQGSLAGVEKGFDQQDIQDANDILIREGRGVTIDGHFSDMDMPLEATELVVPTDDVSAAVQNKPLSFSRFEKILTRLLGIGVANAQSFDVEDIVQQGREIIEATKMYVSRSDGVAASA